MWIELAVLTIAFFVVIGSFFILAIQLFVTLIEFKLTTLAGFVLVPFGLFGKTAFLAERVLGNVASGVKILVLAVIIGIGTNLFSQFTQGSQGFGSNQPTLQDVLAMGLAALTLLGLGIYGPGIATGLTAGAPQLGAGAATGTVSAAWGAGSLGWSALRTGGSLMAGGARLTASAGRRLSSTVSGRPPSPGGSGSPPGGGNSPPPWARRMQRRQAASSGISRVARAIQSGASAGSPTSVNLRGGNP